MIRITKSIVTTLAITGAIAISQSAFAGSQTGQSAHDVFDMSQGTTILASNDNLPENAFQTGEQVFFPDGTAGTLGFIEWETRDFVMLTGIRVFANHDGVSFGNRRSMRRFVLKADTDGDGTFETTCIDESFNPNYSNALNNLATDSQSIDATWDLATPTRAKRWRLEVEQGVDWILGFDGVRLREVDGVGTFDPDIVPGCDGDADGNGVVDAADLGFVIFRLGACP